MERIVKGMVIGKSVTRVDAYEKVTGRAQFVDDMILDKCLCCQSAPRNNRQWFSEIH